MSSLWRNMVLGVACLGLTAYTVHVLRGPQGIPQLVEKRQEMKRLQDEVEALQQENLRKRQRIEELKHERSAQEPEIRERLKMLRANEKAFMIPEAK